MFDIDIEVKNVRFTHRPDVVLASLLLRFGLAQADLEILNLLLVGLCNVFRLLNGCVMSLLADIALSLLL